MTNNEAGNVIIRVNYLDMTRATQQTAMFMSMMSGTKEVRNEKKNNSQSMPKMLQKKIPVQIKRERLHKLEMDAFALTIGYLEDTMAKINIVHSGPYLDSNENLLKDLPLLGKGLKGWDLEVATSPVDGMFDLLEGQDHGTVSALICGGSNNCFVLPSPNNKCDAYFVFTISPKYDLAKIENEIIKDRYAVPPNTPFCDAIAKIDFLNKLRILKKRALEINTMHSADFRHNKKRPIYSFLRSILAENAKLRTLYGSPIVAALSPMLLTDRLDAFAGVVNPTQALILAGATRSTGGALYAIPLFKTDNTHDIFDIGNELNIYKAEDFFKDPNEDVFVILTGITKSEILEGIYFFEKDGEVQECVNAQTLCLRSNTKSKRIINHCYELRNTRIRLSSKAKNEKWYFGLESYFYALNEFLSKKEKWIK